MQMNEKQTLLAGAAALALIVFGALFWIAPVWQFGYAPAAYQPPVLPAQAEPAPENPRGKNRGQSTSIPLRPKS